MVYTDTSAPRFWVLYCAGAYLAKRGDLWMPTPVMAKALRFSTVEDARLARIAIVHEADRRMAGTTPSATGYWSHWSINPMSIYEVQTTYSAHDLTI